MPTSIPTPAESALAELVELNALILDERDPGDAGVLITVNVAAGKTYRIHSRTLQLAISAIEDRESRQRRVRRALEAQEPADVSTSDLGALSRLVADLAGVHPLSATADLDLSQVGPRALAAVLRAGLATLVGEATATAVTSPATADNRHPEAIERAPEVTIGDSIVPVADLPSLARSLDRALNEAQRELKAWHAANESDHAYASENPIRAAVSAALIAARGVRDSHAGFVDDVTVAALDAAAEHLRLTLPRLIANPIVVIDAPMTTQHVVETLAHSRDHLALAAADELRIAARLDHPRP
jgi:hypothetical protein